MTCEYAIQYFCSGWTEGVCLMQKGLANMLFSTFVRDGLRVFV